MQDHLNLIYREEEREMPPLCREEKIGAIPARTGLYHYRERGTDSNLAGKVLLRQQGAGVVSAKYSPLASGRLIRDFSVESILRSETDQIQKSKYDTTADTDQQVVKRVIEIAEKYGVPRVHIALAWLLQKEPVTAPIIGVTKITHLEDAVGALFVKLTQEDVTYLEELHVPHRIMGHQ